MIRTKSYLLGLRDRRHHSWFPLDFVSVKKVSINGKNCGVYLEMHIQGSPLCFSWPKIKVSLTMHLPQVNTSPASINGKQESIVMKMSFLLIFVEKKHRLTWVVIPEMAAAI